jgi:hypothetical protein
MEPREGEETMKTVMMRVVLGLGCGVRDLDEKQSTELLMEISTGGGPDESFLACAHGGDGAFEDIATGNGRSSVSNPVAPANLPVPSSGTNRPSPEASRLLGE